MLVNNRGVIKLCDFGISGKLKDSIAHSKKLGCTGYMSPERLDSHKYDIRADIWSVGISLIELATGLFPYHGSEKEFVVISRIIHDPAPTLPENQFSLEFKEFTDLCLIKDQDKRPKYAKLKNLQFYLCYDKEPHNILDWLKSLTIPDLLNIDGCVDDDATYLGDSGSIDPVCSPCSTATLSPMDSGRLYSPYSDDQSSSTMSRNLSNDELDVESPKQICVSPQNEIHKIVQPTFTSKESSGYGSDNSPNSFDIKYNRSPCSSTLSTRTFLPPNPPMNDHVVLRNLSGVSSSAEFGHDLVRCGGRNQCTFKASNLCENTFMRSNSREKVLARNGYTCIGSNYTIRKDNEISHINTAVCSSPRGGGEAQTSFNNQTAFSIPYTRKLSPSSKSRRSKHGFPLPSHNGDAQLKPRERFRAAHGRSHSSVQEHYPMKPGKLIVPYGETIIRRPCSTPPRNMSPSKTQNTPLPPRTGHDALL